MPIPERGDLILVYREGQAVWARVSFIYIPNTLLPAGKAYTVGSNKSRIFFKHSHVQAIIPNHG